ncbi:MAG: gamma carbonic anhydrase family protein, partial [Oceanicoccus sp.]|uniref:gamma carbonic anhydrase family protein n=1 Tax=Oceanicoccus sp. TaxID=2691044 RepID=UPI002A02DCEA|nr:gamma carbonic anhydrase family protein [Oceanicoccus sp.]
MPNAQGHILAYSTIQPQLHDSVFVAPTAAVIGDVTIDENSSVWFGAVLRGDEVSIRIGTRSNIQDGVVIHGDHGQNVVIGNDVTIGHGAII